MTRKPWEEVGRVVSRVVVRRKDGTARKPEATEGAKKQREGMEEKIMEPFKRVRIRAEKERLFVCVCFSSTRMQCEFAHVS